MVALNEALAKALTDNAHLRASFEEQLGASLQKVYWASSVFSLSNQTLIQLTVPAGQGIRALEILGTILKSKAVITTRIRVLEYLTGVA